MVHLSIMWWLLLVSFLVTILALGCLLILPLRTTVRHVSFFSTAETLSGGVRGTSLHGGSIGVPLTWCLRTTLLLVLLPLMLELVVLRVWSMVPLIRWTLVPLLEALLWIGALTSVVSRGLSLKPPLLSFHFLAPIVNHNSAIHQCLEIGVGVGHKLKLETIIQPLEKETLLVSIICHLIRSIT
jgi:hypothetical protein